MPTAAAASDATQKVKLVVPHLRPGKVYDMFVGLIAKEGLDASIGWPFQKGEVETVTGGKEAIRRWWWRKAYLQPSLAAYRVMNRDKAALVTRDYRRLDSKPGAPALNITQLFQHVQFDEHKADAAFSVLLPMQNGRFKTVHTDRVWLLSSVECSCWLRLASGMSYGPRYATADVLRLLYRSMVPPNKTELRLDDVNYKYREGACYPGELPEFANLTPQVLGYDSDSTHLSDGVQELIKQELRCRTYNGPVAVPEKNSFAERAHGLFASHFEWLPSATGNSPDSPARQDPPGEASRFKLIWPLAEELADIASRNWNVTPMQALGGLTPIQAAMDLASKGRVFRSHYGEFSPKKLFLFLPRNSDTEIVRLSFLRGSELSPLVVRYKYGVYTSSKLNRDRDLVHAAKRGVTIYVQEDARFAVVITDAFPNRPYFLAVMGRDAALAHTLTMRVLTHNFARRVLSQDRLRNPNIMVGAIAGLAEAAKSGSKLMRLVAGMLTYMDRAGHGDLCYVGLPSEKRERLLAEAEAVLRSEAWDEDAEAWEGAPPAAAKPAAVPPEPPTQRPAAAAPSPSDDPFGIMR